MNYIVQLWHTIDWKDEIGEVMKRRFPETEWIILRDTPKQTLIFALYGDTKIANIISLITSLYGVQVEYRELVVV